MHFSKRLPIGAAALAAFAWSCVARGDDAEPIEVDARGSRGPSTRAPKDPTIAGEVIDREALDAPGIEVADVLRGRPGVQTIASGGAGSPATASIRGATPAQLPVYLGGVRINDDVAGSADLGGVPTWLIDRIEIYRGNAPIEADRLGIAGALFFEPRWPRGREVAAGAMAGSFGERGAWTYAALGDRDASALVGVSAQGAKNDYPFANDHGTLLAPTGTTTSIMSNADVTTYDAWALGRARVAGAIIDAFANGTTREQGIPTLALVPSREARGSFERGLGAVRASLPIGPHAKLEAQSSMALARSAYDDPLGELALAAHRVRIDGARTTERIGARLAPTESLGIHGAIDVASETLARDDDARSVVRAHRWESRAALGARQWLGDALSIQALGAVECDGTSGAGGGGACDLAEPTGRAGLAWTRPTWDAFADVSRNARAPALGELYGVSAVVRGNPMLRAESGRAVEAGVRWNASEGLAKSAPPWAMLDAFARWSGDLIAFVRSSEGFAVPVNVGAARVEGIEAEIGAGFLRWFGVDATGTVLDARDTTPGRLVVNDVLPFQSRLVASSRVWFESHVGLAWIDRVRIELRFLHQSSRYADAAGLAVIPAQSTVDAEALAQTRDARVSLRLRVADLLDAERFDIVGFPLPKRAGFIALEAQW